MQLVLCAESRGRSAFPPPALIVEGVQMLFLVQWREMPPPRLQGKISRADIPIVIDNSPPGLGTNVNFSFSII